MLTKQEMCQLNNWVVIYSTDRTAFIRPFTITNPENDSVVRLSRISVCSETCSSQQTPEIQIRALQQTWGAYECPTSCCTSASGRRRISDTWSLCLLPSSGCSSTADSARDISYTCKNQEDTITTSGLSRRIHTLFIKVNKVLSINF